MTTRKKEISSKPTLTYHLGRECENCGKPITDQERKTKRHCSPQVDENGIHHNCRRRKHQKKHQIHEDRLLDWAAIQRQTKIKIEEAITTHGEFVTVAVLEAYGIVLNNCISISHGHEESTLGFLGYKIIVNPFKQSIKIQKND
jgi:hypothetical protein